MTTEISVMYGSEKVNCPVLPPSFRIPYSGESGSKHTNLLPILRSSCINERPQMREASIRGPCRTDRDLQRVPGGHPDHRRPGAATSQPQRRVIVFDAGSATWLRCGSACWNVPRSGHSQKSGWSRRCP